jgi:Uma2 family endonuclease
MSPKGIRHERIRTELAFHMARQAPETLRVASEAQFNLADDAYVMPDVFVYPATTKVDRVRGPSTLLVIEIADGSLAYDLNTKAGLYPG